MLHHTVKSISRSLTYTGLLQSLGGSGIVYTSAVLTNVPVTVSVSMIPVSFLLLQSIYLFDRYYDIQWDAFTNPDLIRRLKPHANFFPYLILLLLSLALVMTFLFSNTNALLVLVVLAVLGFLYPCLFKKVTKYIPLLKNLYVSSIFALLVFFPSVYDQAKTLWETNVIALSLYVLAEAIIMQVILDIKDISGDQQSGILTLPVIIGQRNTCFLLVAVSILVAVLTSVFALNFNIPMLVMLAVGNLFFNLVGIVTTTLHQNSYVLTSAKFILWPLLTALY